MRFSIGQFMISIFSEKEILTSLSKYDHFEFPLTIYHIYIYGLITWLIGLIGRKDKGTSESLMSLKSKCAKINAQPSRLLRIRIVKRHKQSLTTNRKACKYAMKTIALSPYTHTIACYKKRQIKSEKMRWNLKFSHYNRQFKQNSN